jgi:hypothetical protein
LVVKPAIQGCFAISTICALSAPSVNSLTFSSESFGMPALPFVGPSYAIYPILTQGQSSYEGPGFAVFPSLLSFFEGAADSCGDFWHLP